MYHSMQTLIRNVFLLNFANELLMSFLSKSSRFYILPGIDMNKNVYLLNFYLRLFVNFLSIYILKGKNKSTLNERSEMFSASQHGNEFSVNNINKERNDWFLNAHTPTCVLVTNIKAITRLRNFSTTSGKFLRYAIQIFFVIYL